MSETTPAFDLEELKSQIERLDGNTWRIERTLKSTPYEETQLVYRNGSDAGPFIRKLFAEDAGRGDAYEALFSAQARGAHLRHVPLVYDCARTEDGLAVVTEFVPGETLRQHIERVGPGGQTAFFVAQALCDALDELHTGLDAPIIHRDVKPGNVMVAPAGIKLIDLGIARSWREEAERDTTRFGTPGYAPPEQFGFGQTGVTGDIYAVGMTVAFCCTGEDPTAKLREEGFADPRIPSALRYILTKATRLDPAMRFQSAAEMKEAIQMAIEYSPETRPPAAGRRRTGRAVRAVRLIRRSAPARALKYLRNALVIALLMFFVGAMTFAFYQVLSNPSTGAVVQMQANPSVFAIAVVEMVAMYATVFLAAYLLLFKMGLRRFRPFNRFTWKQELPVGVGVIVLAYLLIYCVNILVRWMA